MRRVVLLATGALIAGAALLSRAGSASGKRTARPAHSPSAAVPALIDGEPLVPQAQELNLDTVQRVGDHFEATTADGRRAILTLDPVLQQAAENLLIQARAPRGAIVAMAPDGRILALSGRRSASPAGSGAGTADWRLATEVWAPAASVFKLVTASALIAAGVDPDAKIPFHGGIRSVIESNLRNDRRDNASESLTYAVAHSNNAIVGKLAYLHLEPAQLATVANDLMAPPPLAIAKTIAEIALPREKTLEFARAAAGFSGARFSVLGGALLAATFADDGNQPMPRLIARIERPGARPGSPTLTGLAGRAGELGAEEIAIAEPRRVLPAQVARAVARMMVATCEMGSAAKSFHRPAKRRLEVAGKTGTLTTTSPFYIEHSWFVGYAPADQPQIIVSVLLGNPESWHLRGHEAARRLIDVALTPPRPGSAEVAVRQGSSALTSVRPARGTGKGRRSSRRATAK